MITREYLENRIQELTAARNKLMADVNGNNGAIQLCQQLLDSLSADAADGHAPETETPGEDAEHSERPKANGGTPAP